jgi:hypothetical protein
MTTATRVNEPRPDWRTVWRQGFCPSIPTPTLEILAAALERDDPRLLQGSTTTPPPLMAVQDWPCEAGCLVAYVGWQGEELTTVGEVEEAFAKLCYDADNRLGAAACREVMNFWDDTPRDQARAEFLAECRRELATRGAVCDAA